MKMAMRLCAGLVSMLIGLLGASGCATRKASVGDSISEMSVSEGKSALQHAAEVFATHFAASAQAPSEAAKAASAVRSGLAMLDLRCNLYLDQVGSANQAATNERRQVGLVGGLASALMGLTGSPAKHIAGVATTFSFAASSMETYSSAFLFSDAANSVSKLVRESQQVVLDAVATVPDADLDYPAVVQALVKYESVCRPAQIRALIDAAVANGKVVADVRSSENDVLAVLQVLRAAFDRSFTEQDAIVLFTWARFPELRKDKLNTVEPVKSLMAAGEAETGLVRKLAQAFLPASLQGSPLPGRWAAASESLRTSFETPVATHAASSQAAPTLASPLVLEPGVLTVPGVKPSVVPRATPPLVAAAPEVAPSDMKRAQRQTPPPRLLRLPQLTVR